MEGGLVNEEDKKEKNGGKNYPYNNPTSEKNQKVEVETTMTPSLPLLRFSIP
ncbi:hypothetical protein Csa_015260, partial [Cucumis sativus]